MPELRSETNPIRLVLRLAFEEGWEEVRTTEQAKQRMRGSLALRSVYLSLLVSSKKMGLEREIEEADEWKRVHTEKNLEELNRNLQTIGAEGAVYATLKAVKVVQEVLRDRREEEEEERRGCAPPPNCHLCGLCAIHCQCRPATVM